MERGKNAKTASLIIVIALIVLHIADIPTMYVAYYNDSPFYTRLTYQLFHATWLHLAINVWTFLSAVFFYNIRMSALVTAFIIAATAPIPDIPTIGLSGVVFALFGFISFRFRNKLFYHTWMMFFIVAGFFFPHINAMLHLHCYLTAILIHIFYVFCRRNIR